MSRSIHQTMKSVYGGKSVSEIKAMTEPGNLDSDTLALIKKTGYKRASGRGKHKSKQPPDTSTCPLPEDE